ncbi:hypothetical protein O5833_27180, partial [Escherichia coli]|nr:hypothetical protein [Escherichia coli]
MPLSGSTSPGRTLTLAERQQASLARKRATHKELRVFVLSGLHTFRFCRPDKAFTPHPA